jgi:hypothetical protein
MKLALLASALAALGLSGCVTGYGYSDDGYYYGRPSASVGSYGSIGYGSPGGWRYGYGMSYGYPGYYGYYDPYRGYYYDPYYGYYFGRPPVVIIQRPPGDNHDGHDHGGNDHDGDNDGRRPPWRDLNNLGDNGPHPPPAPLRPRADPPRTQMPSFRDRSDAVRRPERVRMADPSPPVRSYSDDNLPLRKSKSDRRL